MAKIIKNIDSVDHVWAGMLIPAGTSYVCLSQSEADSFAKNDSFISDLGASKAQVYSDSTLISGISASLIFLQGQYLTDADGALLTRPRAFSNTDGFRFRGAAVEGTISALTTGNIDYQITQERYINGGRLLVSTIGPSDKLTCQVIDKDNLLGYGAEFVLDEFIHEYFVPESGNLEVRLDYPAKIPAGFYIRLKYVNSSATLITVKCNLYLHWKAV